MKTQVFDPFAGVRETGGCTFEPHLGWWTQCESAPQAEELGRPFAGKQDAIYIPTLKKTATQFLLRLLKVSSKKLGSSV